MKRQLLLSILVSALLLTACEQNSSEDNSKSVQKAAQKFLDDYTDEYLDLYYASAEGQWQLNTRIVEGDTVAASRAATADQAYADFTGSEANIDSAKKYLNMQDKLTPLQVKQFEAILYMAGNNPAVAGDVVKRRIEATNKQTELLYGYKYMLNGKPVTTNDLDRMLREEKDTEARLAAWQASKEVGTTLKEGLANLQELRNASVSALGYTNYFDYQVSEYGMSSDEMLALTRGLINDVWPLYRELHTWARYELAARYGEEVPDYLPAHWLPNRWGQDWTAMVEVEGLDIDPVLGEKGAEWVMEKGEEFWVSMGFPELPESFWEKSSLYPLPEDAGYSKNNHASAWHMDLQEDVRSLMSVEPNTDWWATVLHELGHIYYYIEYANPDVPPVLRGGANRGYHEAFGSMIGLASLQKPFLENLGLVEPGLETNDTLQLMKEALDFIVHIPWGSGVMTEFEYELYANDLPADQYNAKWWELVKKYQGIVPPSERGEEYCDAATKTHINDDAAQYYDYSISNVLLFQFHDHIARNILQQDPHATNYWGSTATGDFLREVMRPGATVDWREHLEASIGSSMSAKPMVDYFGPLMEYLQRENAGRNYTLPEKP
jgi:peptidyl-dipeptidase A